MTVINDMIGIIAADRHQWTKAAQESCVFAWKRAFEKVPSEVLLKAADGFLRNQKGVPDVQKLWREIRTVQSVMKSLEPKSYVWGPEEAGRIQEDLLVRGDPIADWLEKRGEATRRRPQPRS